MTTSRLPAAVASAVAVLGAVGTAGGATTAVGPLDLRSGQVAGVRIGQPVARALSVFGPRPTARDRFSRGREVLRWDASGEIVVHATNGRITMVQLRDEAVRTVRGDRYRTPLTIFRRHWPGTRRFAHCCAGGTFHHVFRTRSQGVVFAATFRTGVGLVALSLLTERRFQNCFVRECD